MAHRSTRQSRPLKSTCKLAVLSGVCVFALAGCETINEESTDTAEAVRAIPQAQQTVRYQFINAEQAGTILAREDEYTAQLQPTEIGIKNMDATKTTLADLQANYRTGTLEWTQSERVAVQAAIDDLADELAPYARHLPAEVVLAKISDRVEGGLPHTRANMILFSQSALDGLVNQGGNGLKSLFLHELHHVLSRNNTDKHDAYFNLIGFEPCDFTAPSSLRALRLSNPDAASYNHYAPTPVANGDVTADGVIPYLSVTGPYDASTGAALGNYFNFGLLAVNVGDGQCTIAGEEPTLLAPPDLPAFLQLIGGNTGYIIHPEETLADNFTYLILGRQDLPNPEIPENIGAFWASQ